MMDNSRFVLNCYHGFLNYIVFVYKVLSSKPSSSRLFFNDLIKQIKSLGSDSLPLIVITAVFTGMVFSIQAYLSLNRFGAVARLGEYMPVSIYRELGPIIAGLVYTGRSGSYVATEIAAMKANGQIDCMEVMGINSIANIVLPRFIAVIITLPCLVFVFNALSVITCYFMCKYYYHLSTVGFFYNLKYVIEVKFELAMTCCKAMVFGWLVASCATYFGFNAKVDAEGVGRAATYCVVWATLLMLVFDFLVTGLIIPRDISF